MPLVDRDAAARRTRRRRVALLALYYVMALTAAGQKSMTFDETGPPDRRLHVLGLRRLPPAPENGNWPQRLGALPAVLSGAGFPALNQPAWTTSNLYVIGDQYLYFSGNDADTLLSRARAVMALVGVAWVPWSTRGPGASCGRRPGWLSLVLFVFSPTFLAHGPLVTSDMTAALFFTAAAGAIWAAMHRVTPARVLGASVLVAGCALSKLSGPSLAPVALIMLAVRVDRRAAAADRIPGQGRRVPAMARRVSSPCCSACSWSSRWWRGCSSGRPMAFATPPSPQRPQARTRFSAR